jgi:hypothetical protein
MDSPVRGHAFNTQSANGLDLISESVSDLTSFMIT